MAESLSARVSRIVSATIEHAVDERERRGGTVVMAETIREVDRIVDEVRAEQGAAAVRRLQAARQEKLVAERLGKLEDKARFALGQGRDDLAEAAIAQQVDLEAQFATLRTVQADAAEEEARMSECLQSLNNRKAELEDALRTFELASREAGVDVAGGPCRDAARERKVERAQAAFDRAAGGAGAINAARTDAATAAKVGEIDALQRQATIADRLAALREAPRAA